MANKIDSNVDYADYLDMRQPKTFFFSPVLSTEVRDLIRNIDQSKACGFDNIPAKLLVNAVDYISEPLTHIFNSSFSTGVFPNKLKIARVIPIYI